MGKKRKRPGKVTRPRKQLCKTSPSTQPREGPEHSHPVISVYYPQVLTLRQYLLRQIPVSSKSRRRRIRDVGNDSASANSASCELSTFLDTTLVGVLETASPSTDTQDRNDSTNISLVSQVHNTDGTGAVLAQEAIVNYVVRQLVDSNGAPNPDHLLAHGFRRTWGWKDDAPCTIPGLTEVFPNKYVRALKQAPWTDVFRLLGLSGESIMINMLLDCGIFTALDCRKGVYYQVCGNPLFNLKPAQKKQPPAPRQSVATENDDVKPKSANAPVNRQDSQYKANSIVFFRRRMLYARPTFGPNGRIQYGLPGRHVLNRFGSSDSLHETVHVMKYVFPKQFKLQNVFTSMVNGNDPQALCQDYGVREGEIARCEAQNPSGPGQPPRIPKRLQGKPVDLVRQLQTRHKHCSYVHLLQHYCPPEPLGPWKLGPTDSQNEMSQGAKSTGSENLITQPAGVLSPSVALANEELNTDKQKTKSNVLKPKLSLTDYATPRSSVSAFCRAVLRNLLSPQWFGVGQQGNVNQNIVLKHVDRFVRMRRYENVSIHEVCNGIKITAISWLELPNTNGRRNNLSLSDKEKRTELFREFLYYIFDSILIPLIRSSFYVTESQTHKSRLFYFRHDIWRQLTEKPLAELKASMFEELKPEKAASILGQRELGYGSLRLLPKATGVRPILNMRRKIPVNSKWKNARPGWTKTVNSTVGPIYNMLNYETTREPTRLGSCIRSVGEIRPRLRAFKEQLALRPFPKQTSTNRPPFYFVKLDIQSSFDNLPQDKLMRLVKSLVSEDMYHVAKHCEMRTPDEFSGMWPSHGSLSRPARSWVGKAGPAAKPHSLMETIANGGVNRRRNTVFVGSRRRFNRTTRDLLSLLGQHIQDTIVKFGNKYYRQRKGIAQGSVLSNLLCNLLYAEMERDVLGFLDADNTLLLRLVDDFLLITTDPTVALRFLTTMVKGQPEYGVTVNPSKSLVNFAAVVEGTHVPRLVDTSLFPYCGALIDARTLELRKDHDKMLEASTSTAAASLSNTLTVESSKSPGRMLHQKILKSFKAQMSPMYVDTKHNSLTVVLSNLHANFITTAMKMYRYMRTLRGRSHPTPEVVIRVIGDLTELAHRLVQTKRDSKQQSTTCMVQKSQLKYLAAAAFRHVFSRKQTRYGAVLSWLDQLYKANQPKTDGKSMRLAQVVRKGNLLYGSWRF